MSRVAAKMQWLMDLETTSAPASGFLIIQDKN